MADREPKNEQDFLRMQQEAIRRVRDMQARARRTLEDAGVPLEPPSPPQHEPQEPPSAPEPDAAGPFEEDARQAASEDAPPPEHAAPSAGRAKGFPFNLSLDTEQIMLLLIIYLLYKDHGDQYLMMALAYLLLT